MTDWNFVTREQAFMFERLVVHFSATQKISDQYKRISNESVIGKPPVETLRLHVCLLNSSNFETNDIIK